MTASSRLAAAALALLLAGCAAPPAVPPPPQPSAPSAHLELSDCSGWEAGATAPALLSPGDAPPGWEPQPGEVTEVRMDGLECARLSLGSLERPARLVLDLHSRIVAPAACRAGYASYGFYVLNALWTDDAAVVELLNRSYGLPARLGPITTQAQAAGTGALHTWTWGERPSTLTVADDGQDASSNPVKRVFWPRGDGLGALALVPTVHGEAHAQSLAYGTLAPPMLLSSRAGGTFAGQAAWYPSLAVSGEFALYKDRSCLVPEAP